MRGRPPKRLPTVTDMLKWTPEAILVEFGKESKRIRNNVRYGVDAGIIKQYDNVYYAPTVGIFAMPTLSAKEKKSILASKNPKMEAIKLISALREEYPGGLSVKVLRTRIAKKEAIQEKYDLPRLSDKVFNNIADHIKNARRYGEYIYAMAEYMIEHNISNRSIQQWIGELYEAGEVDKHNKAEIRKRARDRAIDIILSEHIPNKGKLQEKLDSLVQASQTSGDEYETLIKQAHKDLNDLIVGQSIYMRTGGV